MTTDKTYSYGALLRNIGQMLEKNINKVLKDYDITVVQGRLLCELALAEETPTMKELEHLTETSQQAMAAMVARMECKGYVESFQDNRDKRVKRVKITDKGRGLCEEIKSKLDMFEKVMIEGIREEDMDKVADVLGAVYENCRDFDPDRAE